MDWPHRAPTLHLHRTETEVNFFGEIVFVVDRNDNIDNNDNVGVDNDAFRADSDQRLWVVFPAAEIKSDPGLWSHFENSY